MAAHLKNTANWCIHFISAGLCLCKHFPQRVCEVGQLGEVKVRGRSLHGVVGLPVLQGLPLLLRLVLQVVPLLQAPQHQAVEDVLVGLLDEMLEQPQRHDADLGTGRRGGGGLPPTLNQQQCAECLLADRKVGRCCWNIGAMSHPSFVWGKCAHGLVS